MHHKTIVYNSLQRKCVSVFTGIVFLTGTVFSPGFALARASADPVPLNLPPPGTWVGVSEPFEPTLVKGISIQPENPFQFDVIVEPGDDKPAIDALKEQAMRMTKYFMASLTVPENQTWVNLSPFEAERIIPEEFGLTEMGRDLLAQDYLLKQMTASLIHPERGEAKEFWERVYSEIQQTYGVSDIPVNAFHKVWIVPEKAVVYEHKGSAFVVQKFLRVMMEEDYLALTRDMYDRPDRNVSEYEARVTEIMKEIVVPAIEKEVNTGKNFANLRQIYNSMILAVWFKKTLKSSIFGQLYVDRNKVRGIETGERDAKIKIYEQYVEAFKKGVFNYIEEEYDPMTQQIIPRKYFSGGAVGLDPAALTVIEDAARLTTEQRNALPQQAILFQFQLETPQEAEAVEALVDGEVVAPRVVRFGQRVGLTPEVPVEISLDGGRVRLTYYSAETAPESVRGDSDARHFLTDGEGNILALEEGKEVSLGEEGTLDNPLRVNSPRPNLKILANKERLFITALISAGVIIENQAGSIPPSEQSGSGRSFPGRNLPSRGVRSLSGTGVSFRNTIGNRAVQIRRATPGRDGRIRSSFNGTMRFEAGAASVFISVNPQAGQMTLQEFDEQNQPVGTLRAFDLAREVSIGRSISSDFQTQSTSWQAEHAAVTVTPRGEEYLFDARIPEDASPEQTVFFWERNIQESSETVRETRTAVSPQREETSGQTYVYHSAETGSVALADIFGGDANDRLFVVGQLEDRLRQNIEVLGPRVDEGVRLGLIRDTILGLNGDVAQRRIGLSSDLGASLGMAMVYEDSGGIQNLLMINMGTTRIYVKRSDGSVVQLSEDDTVEAAGVEGEKTLTDFLGREAGRPGFSESQFQVHTLEGGEQVFVISDAVVRLLGQDSLIELAAESETPEELSRKLVQAAQELSLSPDYAGALIEPESLTAAALQVGSERISPEGLDSRVMSSSVEAGVGEAVGETPVGGIDLNAGLLNLEIRRDSDGLPLPFELQPIVDMNIEGFTPVLLNVTPVTSLPLLTGIYEPGQDSVEEDVHLGYEDPTPAGRLGRI